MAGAVAAATLAPEEPWGVTQASKVLQQRDDELAEMREIAADRSPPGEPFGPHLVHARIRDVRRDLPAW
jgi:hypothetical protein